MSADADTHTAATAYGEVEIEVVECASCGQTVQRSAANDILIGDVIKETDYSTLGKVSVDVNRKTYARGYVCETCQSVGLVDFPSIARLNAHWRAVPSMARYMLLAALISVFLLFSAAFISVVVLT